MIGVVEGVERYTGKANPRRKPAKYLDPCSGRIRSASIGDDSAASIKVLVSANLGREI